MGDLTPINDQPPRYATALTLHPRDTDPKIRDFPGNTGQLATLSKTDLGVPVDARLVAISRIQNDYHQEFYYFNCYQVFSSNPENPGFCRT